MTHSLHRQGNVQSLEGDYVVFTYAERSHDALAARKAHLRRGFPRVYAMLRTLKRGIWRVVRVRKPKEELEGPFVLSSKEELVRCLRMLKEENTGRSVIVSGLIGEVNNCLAELGLCPHTVQFSLGYFGKTELLPSEEVLEITTMCGHHMISPRLVERLTSAISKGRITPQEAVEAMGKLCTCHIFNEVRAAKLIRALAEDHRAKWERTEPARGG